MFSELTNETYERIYSGCLERPFSVNKSSANYVILSKKINLFLFNKTLHKHGSKLPITNIAVEFAY